ncbi:MAG TPA: TonB-dependent receptor [Longimicrobiales bacterium]
MNLTFRKYLPAAFALLLLLGAAPAWAQTGAVTGRVTDAETGAPLGGAQVEAVTGGRVAATTLTDANGQYRLADLPAGTYSIVVTLVGYATRQVDGVRVVDGGTSIQAIALTAAAFELNPIVVSASKRQEKVLDAPASVAVVDSRTVAERPATTPVDHLRSTPGVDIVTQGVQSTNVVVRGFNNIFSGSLHALTDNRIAGVPSLRVNALHFIPSTDDDVERMEVVLGPGAALYGPNTADGVLHIITKSPLDEQGTSVAVAGGTQDVLNGTFRTSHLLSDNFGIKLSGQFFQAEEWEYVDPVEAAERNKFANDISGFFRDDLIRAAGISEAEADRRIARIGARDIDVQRFGADLRADWRIKDDFTAVIAGGLTRVGSGIELTGLGAAQAKDWTYSYVQARATWGRFFAQAYANMSNAGETYLLRNGAPITDRSKLYVAQIQHGLTLGDRQDFTYGLDFLYTDPVTEGTINGIYEDDDQTTEFGAYIQSETALSDKFDLVLAGRMDTHSALPEAIFSPRAALVFQPTETHAFRITYNRAFSTPSSLNQFLDLGSAIPDENAARLGYSLRIQGTGTDGFSFRQANGGYLMRSPFTPPAAGGPAGLVPADASTYWAAVVQVLAQKAAAAGQPLDPSIVAYLSSLSPGAAISSSYLNPSTRQTGSLDALDLEIEPIRESTSTTFEAGYKGVLGERLLLAADFWYSTRENLVTPLTIATPFITLNGEETIGYLTQRFVADLGMDQATAMATAISLTCGPGGTSDCTQGLAAIPVGVISSEDVNANGPQVLTTYFNVEDELDVYGLDLSATALLTDEWSLNGTLSLVNDNVFETERGEQVTLNAPKTKGSLAVTYRGRSNGLNGEVRARYNDEFPVISGVYSGTACIVDSPLAEPCVDSYLLFDLVLGYRLPIQGATLQLSVQNLLDEDYRSFPGVPDIGRMALVRLRYDF